MKECKNCKKVVRTTDKYCRNCGSKVQKELEILLINITKVILIIILILIIVMFILSYLI